MVQTRASAKRIESGQEQEPQQGTAVVPIRKRRRDGAESSRKRQRGNPRELCQLNLDVLFLIAAYIHPLDLLNLARTCKSLRDLLMDKSSAFVWKTAFRQVDHLPDCPTDLTEPEYANLVFYARCHGCGKHAKKVLWELRRRYCPDCREARLRRLSSCPHIIQRNDILPTEHLPVEGEMTLTMWVDQEQMDSILQEYACCSDKERFLSDKRSQRSAIYRHARECKYWEKIVASQRRLMLEFRRQERDQSIFDRLKQHGYEPEIAYFGHYAIQQSHKPFFRTSKPLTDKEWAQMWPEWLETMNNFRSQRLDKTVFQARRDSLTSEYFNYVAFPSPDTPTFDLLPYVTDLARFPPFRDIIQSPEGTDLGVKPFDSAFAQLPALVGEWKNQLDAEFTEMVRIPSHLSLQDASGGRGGTSSSATRMKPSKPPTDILRLACAVFDKGHIVAHYPEVLSATPDPAAMIWSKRNLERTMSTWERFHIKFFEEAPYIVHACGLNSSVATIEDMDSWNARLKCLRCANGCVMTWRHAMRHALYCRSTGQVSRSESPRWLIVSDEYMEAIEIAEQSTDLLPTSTRCLLCLPRVGDSRLLDGTILHLINDHRMGKDDIKEGVHYKHVGMRGYSGVMMVEEEGQVTFKVKAPS